MRKLSMLVISLFFSTSSLFADGGIIYGPNWSYLIQSPSGFKWDSDSMKKQGIWGLFYLSTEDKFNASKLNMYINPVRKDGDYPKDLDALIKWDTEWYKSQNPSLDISYYEKMDLGDNKTAKVYKYDDKKRNYYMYYGYVVEENASFVFVLIARSLKERDDYEKSYKELLGSFIYMNSTSTEKSSD